MVNPVWIAQFPLRKVYSIYGSIPNFVFMIALNDTLYILKTHASLFDHMAFKSLIMVCASMKANHFCQLMKDDLPIFLKASTTGIQHSPVFLTKTLKLLIQQTFPCQNFGLHITIFCMI